MLQSSHKGTRDFYNISSTKLPTSTKLKYHSFWEQSLNVKIPENIWMKVYRICFKSIKNNNISWLQYRILYRILGTNEHLFRITKRISSLCNICDDFSETILHLFTECIQVNLFWLALKTEIKMRLDNSLKIDPPSIILGNLEPNQPYNFLNKKYIKAKRYIFKSSKSKKRDHS